MEDGNGPALGDMDEYVDGTGPLDVDLGEFPVRNGEELTTLFPNSLLRGDSCVWFFDARSPKSLARSLTDMDAMVETHSVWKSTDRLKMLLLALARRTFCFAYRLQILLLTVNCIVACYSIGFLL